MVALIDNTYKTIYMPNCSYIEAHIDITHQSEMITQKLTSNFAKVRTTWIVDLSAGGVC